jgi:hypothetical protein
MNNIIIDIGRTVVKYLMVVAVGIVLVVAGVVVVGVILAGRQ